jgi:hypothetical protein
MRSYRHRLALIGVAAVSLIAACVSKRTAPNASSPSVDAVPVAVDRFDGCDMCHADVADEVIGTRHQAKRVGCVKCHGKSLPHVQDENNEVKPDRVFARKDIDRSCSSCHKCSRPDATKLSASPKPGQKVCIDCHSTHKIVRVKKPDRT